jgi:acyl-CoA thioester hydrolase
MCVRGTHLGPPMSSPHLSPFVFPLRVYWEDTDAGGVVFYANYLKFFERARTEWLRSFGHSQERLRTQASTMFIVTDTAVRYLQPAKLDDLLHITVQVQHAGLARMTLAQQALRTHADGHDVVVAEGTIRIACVHTETFKPQRIPASMAGSMISAFGIT